MTLYLSRIKLNIKNKNVHRDIQSPHEMHRTIMRAFPGTQENPRKTFGVLFRLESDGTILVQSKVEPDWKNLHIGYLLEPVVLEMDTFVESLKNGGEYRFKLYANTIKKIDGKKFGIIDNAGRSTWLVRQSENHGFDIIDAAVIRSGEKIFAGNNLLPFSSTLYEGVLRIVDVQKFKIALIDGVGVSRAYGFGLLSIARAV